MILKIEDKLLSDEDLNKLEQDIELLFKSNPTIDGVFAVNELYAVTAIKVARKLGLEIPKSLQVISFSDGVLSKHCTPSLTTVSQHGQKIGEESANLLINRLESEELDYNDTTEEVYETVVIQTDLIERDSTK